MNRRRRGRGPRHRALRIIALVGLALAAAIVLQAEDRLQIPGGPPRPQGLVQRLLTHHLENPGFAVGYSEWHRAPLWAAFKAQAIPKDARYQGRPERFRRDRRTLWPVTSEDYTGTGYDRGHLAPSYLIAMLHGRKAQQSTFRMSNVAPQAPRLNQLLWQRLEEVEADHIAPMAEELWVLTGPVYFGKRLASGVALPSAFWRVWLDESPPRVLAFLMPQEVCGDEPLDQFVVSIDEIERKAGLDLFPRLPEDWQARFEAQKAPEDWRLSRHARRPARYADRHRDLPCPHRAARAGESLPAGPSP